MSGGGKKKKNIAVATKKLAKKHVIILLVIWLISFVTIISFIIFPNILNNRILINIVAVVNALIVLFLACFSVVSNLKRKALVKHQFWILVVICLTSLVTSAQAIITANNDYTAKGSNGEVQVEVEEEPMEASFVINFNDALFSNCTDEDLEKNKDAIAAQIIKAVKNGTAVNLEINDEDYDLYEDCVLMSQDYENVYDRCIEFHIFEKYNKNELVSFLNSAIDCRKDGDKAYSTYENRRCIALRYNDKGYELCRNENINDAFAAYKSAIEYGVGALCVQFKSRNKGNSDTEKIIDAILRGYKGVTELTTEDNGDYKKAVVLIEIFEKIKEKL